MNSQIDVTTLVSVVGVVTGLTWGSVKSWQAFVQVAVANEKKTYEVMDDQIENAIGIINSEMETATGDELAALRKVLVALTKRPRK